MKTSDLTTIEICGTPYERGIAHGETLRSKITDIIGLMRAELANTHGIKADQIIASFLENTNFAPAIERWTPGLLDEVEGIAVGANASLQDILTLNLQDEIWCYGFKTMAHEWQGPYNKCTCAAAIAKNGEPTLSGQNMDVPFWHDEYQILMRISSDGGDVESLVFSSAGLIALNGLNNKGVGVCVNALLELEHSVSGVPVVFVIRRLLELADTRQAEAFVREVPHASGQNYVISGHKQIVSLECSANQVVPFFVDGQEARTWHANEALANDDKAYFRAITKDLPPDKFKPGFENSKARMQTVAAVFSDPNVEIDIATLKQLFASKEIPEFPISLHFDREAGVMGFTCGCVIYEHRRDGTPLLHVAAGPPDICTFERFGFDD